MDTCQVLLDRRLVDRKLDQDVVVLSLRSDQCKAISFIANLIQPFVAGVWVSYRMILIQHVHGTCMMIGHVSVFAFIARRGPDNEVNI